MSLDCQSETATLLREIARQQEHQSGWDADVLIAKLSDGWIESLEDLAAVDDSNYAAMAFPKGLVTKIREALCAKGLTPVPGSSHSSANSPLEGGEDGDEEKGAGMTPSGLLMTPEEEESPASSAAGSPASSRDCGPDGSPAGAQVRALCSPTGRESDAGVLGDAPPVGEQSRVVENGGAEVENGGKKEKLSPTLLEAVSEKSNNELDGGKEGKLEYDQTLDADMEPGEYEKESYDFPLAGSALTDKLDDKVLEKKKKSKSDPKNKTKKHKGKSPPRTTSSRKRTGSSSPDDHENEKRSYDTRAKTAGVKAEGENRRRIEGLLQKGVRQEDRAQFLIAYRGWLVNELRRLEEAAIADPEPGAGFDAQVGVCL